MNKVLKNGFFCFFNHINQQKYKENGKLKVWKRRGIEGEKEGEEKKEVRERGRKSAWQKERNKRKNEREKGRSWGRIKEKKIKGGGEKERRRKKKARWSACVLLRHYQPVRTELVLQAFPPPFFFDTVYTFRKWVWVGKKKEIIIYIKVTFWWCYPRKIFVAPSSPAKDSNKNLIPSF